MVTLASSEWSPGMPLNSLQYSGQPPTATSHLAQGVSRVQTLLEEAQPLYDLDPTPSPAS